MISIMDRGLNYGDGLFETIAIRSGRLRLLDYHLDRLTNGLIRLGFQQNVDISVLSQRLQRSAAGTENGIAKLIVTRGCGPRGYQAPEQPQPAVIIDTEKTRMPGPEFWRQGVRVRYCETPISLNPALAGLKSLNRLDQVLARQEWHDSQIAEGLMLDPRGRVVSGTRSNLFVVTKGILHTARLDESGVHGVMRRLVMELANSSDRVCRESDLTREMLAEADEIFITNSQFGIWPVRQLEDQSLEVGAITRELMAQLGQRGVTECAVF